nr:MAG TPA: hypothetical protein [Caudoviricetes sp.]
MITDKFDSSIVSEAISTIAKTNNPKEFAINNEVVYDVAVEAVRIMRSELKGDLLDLSCMMDSCQDNIADFIIKIKD